MVVLAVVSLMFQQTTDLGKPKIQEHWACADEGQGMHGDIGKNLKNCSSRRAADVFGRRVREVSRILRDHGNPRYAYPPHVDVQQLIDIAKRHPNVRPRTVQLTEPVAVGEMVQPRHLTPSHSGALRCK